jgi:hypothetical protein
MYIYCNFVRLFHHKYGAVYLTVNDRTLRTDKQLPLNITIINYTPWFPF